MGVVSIVRDKVNCPIPITRGYLYPFPTEYEYAYAYSYLEDGNEVKLGPVRFGIGSVVLSHVRNESTVSNM